MDGRAFAAELRTIAEELAELTELPRLAAELAAPRIAENVAAEFDAGSGPTGDGWAPLKSGGASHLEQTGAMRGKLRVVADGLLVRGTLPAPANIHQYGSRKMVARPIFPMPDALPPSWEASLEAASTEALEKLTPHLQSAK